MSLITMTHTIGGRGSSIARKVADALDLPLYDDAALEKIAVENGMSGKDLQGFGQGPPGFFTRFLSTNPMACVDLMESVIYRVSREGKGVIIGHGSQILLREFDCAFHIRIHAPKKNRIAELAQRRQLTPFAATKLLQKTDDRQKGFFKYAFNLDWNDFSLYDLMINTGQMTADTASSLIVNAIESGDFAACSLKALEAMDNLSLEKKARAAIAKRHIEMENLSIEVPEKGRLHVTGLVRSASERDIIQSATKDLVDAGNAFIDVPVFSGGHI